MRALIALSLILAPGLGAEELQPANGPYGTVSGTVTLAATGTPVHNTSVLLSPLGRTVSTNASGEFAITNIPPGTYSVMAHMHALTDAKQTVTVAAGATGNPFCSVSGSEADTMFVCVMENGG